MQCIKKQSIINKYIHKQLNVAGSTILVISIPSFSFFELWTNPAKADSLSSKAHSGYGSLLTDTGTV